MCHEWDPLAAVLGVPVEQHLLVAEGYEPVDSFVPVAVAAVDVLLKHGPAHEDAVLAIRW